MINRLILYYTFIPALFCLLFLSPAAKPQSFDGFQMNLLEDKTKELIDNYESYFNLIGDVSEDWEDRRQHYGRQFINLFSNEAYHYNDLDPTETTSKDFSIEAYAGNIMLFYTQSGISCRMDKDRIAFGSTRQHQGNTWTIDAYVEKHIDGLYMGHPLNRRTIVVSFRIAFSFQNTVLKDFIIAGVTASSRDEMAKVVSSTAPRGTREEQISSQPNQSGTFTDPRDGQTYKWVKIGEQVWMAENLNYKTANGSWCYKNNEINCDHFGRLYNWVTAKTICPTGWHLPAEIEWLELKTFIGDSGGQKLKAIDGWNGTNDFGFNALPGGARYTTGLGFVFINEVGYWWSETERSSSMALSTMLSYDYEDLSHLPRSKRIGFSIRCVQD